MCLASKYIDHLKEAQREINKGLRELSLLVSKYDKELSTFYHDLETAKFNAAEGYFLSKQLQELLQKRRLVKHEYEKLKCVRDSINITQINSLVQRADRNLKKFKAKNDYVGGYTEHLKISVSDLLEEVNQQLVN